MVVRICIFDIPLICNLIATHLDRDDVFRCALVNRTWYAQFRSAVWSRAHNHRPLLDRASPSFQEFKYTLLANAGLLRQLTVHGDSIALLLIGKHSNCINLTELSYIPKASCSEYSRDTVPRANAVGVWPLFVLVAQNQRLRRLKIDLKNTLYHSCDPFLSVLAQHPSLTSLTLGDEVIKLPGAQYLSQNLPRQIEYFQIGRIPFGERRRVFDAPGSVWSSVPLYQRLKTVRLGDLSIDLIVRDTFGELGPTLSEHCQALERLEMFTLIDRKEAYSNLLRQLKYLRIKALHLQNSGPTVKIDDHDSIIIAPWRNTLEHVEFSRDFELGRNDVLWFLEACPKLRTLVVPEKSGLKLKDFLSLSWGCLGLERLSLTVLDGPMGLLRACLCLSDVPETTKKFLLNGSGQLGLQHRSTILKSLKYLCGLRKLQDVTLVWPPMQEQTPGYRFEYKQVSAGDVDLWQSLVCWVDTLLSEVEEVLKLL
ncbi:hypothetical protein BGZ68_000274 [Mortierella alpina]|nr:hypothetical protein BGZ68_000274 [Mortierella alpina]